MNLEDLLIAKIMRRRIAMTCPVLGMAEKWASALEVVEVLGGVMDWVADSDIKPIAQAVTVSVRAAAT